MADNLSLRVVLALQERVLAPLKRIQSGSRDAANALKATRDRLKELNAQQAAVGHVQKQQAEFARLNNELKIKQSLLAGMRAGGVATAAQLKREESGVRKLAEALELQRVAAGKARAALNAMGVSGSLSAAQTRLKADIDNATGAMTKQRAELQRLAEQQARVTKLKQQTAKGAAIGAGIAGAGAVGVYAGKRTVAAGLSPAKSFMGHEDAMLGIARQVPGARNEMGQLTEVYRQAERDVRALSGQIPLATTEIAAMMTAAARMEVPTGQLKEFTLLASEMATAFDAVPDQVTESMGKVAKNFKIPLTDIRGLADSINYLDDNAISKGADIIDFLNRTSGVVSTVAMSARDAAALGSTLLTLGERAETASTAANAIVQKFAAATKGTKKFKSAMEEIGLSTEAVQKGMSKDATGTLNQVIEAIGKLPEDKRIGVMVELVGMEHSDTLAKLVDKPEELARQRTLANGGEAKGSMAREAGARNATMSAQARMSGNRLFNLSAVVGGNLKTAFKDLLSVVNPALERLTEWVQAHPTLVGWTLKAVIVLGALIAASSALLIPLGLIIAKGMLLRYLFSRLSLALFGVRTAAAAAGPAMGLLSRVFALVRSGAMLAGRAILFIGRALLMNPIGLLVTAIAVAAYLIYQYWGPIKEFFSGLWDDIKAGAAAVWQDLGGSVPAVLATIGAAILNWSPLGLFYQAFAGVMSWFGVEMPAKFTEFGANIISGLVNGITSGWARLKEVVSNTATSVGQWFTNPLAINSPSRVFMQYGGWISEGAALGIAGGQGAVRNAALGMATAATLAMPLAADAAALRLDTRPPLGASMAAAPAGGGGSTYTITINPAPGMDPQAIARAVSAELDKRERSQQSRRLSALHDID